MNHLTVDKIIDFVSISVIDAKSIELADYVNTHICNCDECLKKVEAFQLIYDEMLNVADAGDFKTVMYKMALENKIIGFKDNVIESSIELQLKYD